MLYTPFGRYGSVSEGKGLPLSFLLHSRPVISWHPLRYPCITIILFSILSLLLTGALWDLDWRHKQQRGQTQLYLLLSSFSPLPSPDCDSSRSAYYFLLASALSAGFSPTREDKKGRSALFLLCERMACVTLGQWRNFHLPLSLYSVLVLILSVHCLMIYVWLSGYRTLYSSHSISFPFYPFHLLFICSPCQYASPYLSITRLSLSWLFILSNPSVGLLFSSYSIACLRD